MAYVYAPVVANARRSPTARSAGSSTSPSTSPDSQCRPSTRNVSVASAGRGSSRARAATATVYFEPYRAGRILSDMRVDPPELQARQHRGLLDRLQRKAFGDRRPELRVRAAGVDVGVRVALDPRRDPHQDGLAPAGVAGEPVQAFQLVGVVGDDHADLVLNGQAQLPVGLVVAVQRDG